MDEEMMELKRTESEMIEEITGNRRCGSGCGRPGTGESRRADTRQKQIRGVGPKSVSDRRTGTTANRIGGMKNETDGMAYVWDWVEAIVSKGLHHLERGEGHGTTWRRPAKTTTLWENGIIGPGGKQGNKTTYW